MEINIINWKIILWSLLFVAAWFYIIRAIIRYAKKQRQK